MDKELERIEKYKSLEGPLQELYGSPASGEEMYRIYSAFRLSPESYKAYAEIVGDTILGFNKITDIPRLLQQKLGVSADESQRITSKLIDFLSLVVQREEEGTRIKKEELGKLADTFAAPENLNKTSASDMQKEHIEQIHTMEGDMQRVHGYGAYTELQEKKGGAHTATPQDELLDR